MPAIIIWTLIILILSGLLWYDRPNADVWLFGSIFLGVLWGTGFLRLITRSGK
jgi:hypothetical protein